MGMMHRYAMDYADTWLYPGYVSLSHARELEGIFGPYDLRRTANTLLHEAGSHSGWIEKCLAHEQNGVRAVYNKAEYQEQRASMLQDWADMIDARGAGQ